MQTIFKRVEGLQRLNFQFHASTSRSRIGQDPHLSLHVCKLCKSTSGVGVLEQGSPNLFVREPHMLLHNSPSAGHLR